MKNLLSKSFLFVLVFALAIGGANAVPVPAGPILVEPGHALNQLVDSSLFVPLDPSHDQLEFPFCGLANGNSSTENFVGSSSIESIGIDPTTGTLFVQVMEPTGVFVSDNTCLYSITPTVPGIVSLNNPQTFFGINDRGADLHFDPATGLLLTQNQNMGPDGEIAFHDPFAPLLGTYAPFPVGSGDGYTFGMDFATAVPGSDVPPGEVVFTGDVGANGIHSAFLGGVPVTHAIPLTPGDDMVVQPDGTWVHIPDFDGVITAYSPLPPHVPTPSPTGLNLFDIFDNQGLPFECGSRATVCDLSGDIYVSSSCSPGGSAIFRIDPTLTTATLLLTIGPDEGLQDLTLGPATSGVGQSVFFSIHDSAGLSFFGIPGTEEVWELTVPECVAPEPPCDPDPASQGYWHRQCLGVPANEGGIDPGRNGRGPQSPTEPNFVPDLMSCGFDALEGMGLFGETTCTGMDADPPSDPCERAKKQTTALILNVCSGRLTNACEVDVSAEGCSATSVGDLLDELAGLIQGGDCQQAAECAAAINEGTGVVTAAPIQASFDKSGSPASFDKASSDATTPMASQESSQPQYRASIGTSGTTTSTPTEEVRAESQAQVSDAPTSIAIIEGSSGTAETATPIAPKAGDETTHPSSSARTAENHLRTLKTPGASIEARKAAEEALFDALGGGYQPALRVEIVRALLGKVDVALHSLLAEHLLDILDEAQEAGNEKAVKEAEQLLKQIRSHEEQPLK